MIVFKCPYCEGIYEMADDVASRKLECGECSNKIVIPELNSDVDVKIMSDGESLKVGILLAADSAAAARVMSAEVSEKAANTPAPSGELSVTPPAGMKEPLKKDVVSTKSDTIPKVAAKDETAIKERSKKTAAGGGFSVKPPSGFAHPIDRPVVSTKPNTLAKQKSPKRSNAEAPAAVMLPNKKVAKGGKLKSRKGQRRGGVSYKKQRSSAVVIFMAMGVMFILLMIILRVTRSTPISYGNNAVTSKSRTNGNRPSNWPRTVLNLNDLWGNARKRSDGSGENEAYSPSYPDATSWKSDVVVQWQALTDGVDNWALRRDFTTALWLYSESSFPVLSGREGLKANTLLAACAPESGGKILVFSDVATQSACFGRFSPQNTRFFRNCIEWFSGAGQSSAKPTILHHPGGLAADFLAGFVKDFDVTPIDALIVSGEPCTDHVYWLDRDVDVSLCLKIRDFLTKGGSLITTAENLKKIKSGADMLHVWGVGVGRSKIGAMTAHMPHWDVMHACWALAVAEEQERDECARTSEELRQVGRVLIETMRAHPKAESPFLLKLENAFNLLPANTAALAVPLNPLQKVALALRMMDQEHIPVVDRPKSPFAAIFPGEISGNVAPISSVVSIDGSRPFRQSLGFYAAPGEKVTLTFPQQAVTGKYKVVIGSQTYVPSSLDDWRRAPDVSTEWLVATPTMTVGTPFGGIIYVVIPVQGRTQPVYDPPFAAYGLSKLDGGTLDVHVKNAYQVARFDKGTSNAEAFRNEVAKYGVPFAELCSDRLVLTISATRAFKLKSPSDVLDFWADALTTCGSAAGMEENFSPSFPLRIVVDNVSNRPDIKYPVHWPESKSTIMIDVDDSEGGEYVSILSVLAGFYTNRIGRALNDYEVAGTLISAYLHHDRTKTDHRKLHPKFSRSSEQRYCRIHLNTKSRVAKADVYARMVPYNMIIDTYGWKPILDTFTYFNSLSGSKIPTTRDRMNYTLVNQLSLRTKKNMFPFFRIWGVKTTAKPSYKVKSYETWMPPGFPDKYLIIR